MFFYTNYLRYTKAMECPVCKHEMKKVRWDISHNPNENNKEYDRSAYHCPTDDAWLTVETPKETSSKDK